eukprot:4509612-Amphidinium_carterae.1
MPTPPTVLCGRKVNVTGLITVSVPDVDALFAVEAGWIEVRENVHKSKPSKGKELCPAYSIVHVFNSGCVAGLDRTAMRNGYRFSALKPSDKP